MENASKFLQGSASSESIEKLIHELAMDKPKRFSHEDITSFTSNFGTKIGFGAFGNVYKGRFPNGVEVAVKVLVDNEVVEEMFMAEVSTMGRTYHRNLIKLYGFCFDDNVKALVYEYMTNGSLDRFLYQNDSSIKWEKLYDIVVGTAKGLLYLHDGCYEQIIHHDIKPGNVLLNADMSPKITDFGLAKLMDRDESHLTMSRIRGTPGYAAPETFTPMSEITCKCDVYSFGMMLFEILGRRRNRRGNEWFPKQVWEKFKNGQLDEIIGSSGITGENIEKAMVLCLVALWCIQFTPQSRPSMSSVLTMLEKGIRVTTPPDPFLSSNLISPMQPSDERSLISSKQPLEEHSIPEHEGAKPDKACVVQQSAFSVSGAETVVTKWYSLDLTINEREKRIVCYGANSNSELVIKGNARILDPQSEEIVRVLPRPTVLRDMKQKEIDQLFLQFPENIRMFNSRKKYSGSIPSGYLEAYTAMASTIPSMKKIARELKIMIKIDREMEEIGSD